VLPVWLPRGFHTYLLASNLPGIVGLNARTMPFGLGTLPRFTFSLFPPTFFQRAAAQPRPARRSSFVMGKRQHSRGGRLASDSILGRLFSSRFNYVITSPIPPSSNLLSASCVLVFLRFLRSLGVLLLPFRLFCQRICSTGAKRHFPCDSASAAWLPVSTLFSQGIETQLGLVLTPFAVVSSYPFLSPYSLFLETPQKQQPMRFRAKAKGQLCFPYLTPFPPIAFSPS